MRTIRSFSRALALGAALALPAAAQIPVTHGPGGGFADSATIETSARREISIAPDRASIVLAVETRAPSAGVAAQANARAQRGVLDTLRAIGIAPSQIATAGFTVQENWEPTPKGGMERNGFVARNAITVKLTQLDRAGAVIDAALARGATNVSDIQFSATNTADAQRAALADAAAQAKADAATLAKALGGTLGPLITATTRGDAQQPSQYYWAVRGVKSQSTTPIEPSDITVSAYVLARWVFVPGPAAP
ncbi:MAG TPA: SIMPL domain-containing protein [Gemmatimonadaceae bacterium]|nr:SIMPL domain-containing protein [Gemmatimonadaceae bacterium]